MAAKVTMAYGEHCHFATPKELRAQIKAAAAFLGFTEYSALVRYVMQQFLLKHVPRHVLEGAIKREKEGDEVKDEAEVGSFDRAGTIGVSVTVAQKRALKVYAEASGISDMTSYLRACGLGTITHPLREAESGCFEFPLGRVVMKPIEEHWKDGEELWWDTDSAVCTNKKHEGPVVATSSGEWEPNRTMAMVVFRPAKETNDAR